MVYYNSGTSTTAEGLQIYREGSSTKFPPYGGTDAWATLLNTQSAGEDVNLKNVVNVSASGGGSYTCTDANKTYCITATAGTLTINLPTAVPANRWIIIKDKGGTTNTTTGLWTVDASGTETIDGSTTKQIRRAYSIMYLVSDGTNWQTLSLDAPIDDTIQVREKTTAGAGTWVAPDATTGTPVRWAFVQLLGGGGGGGGANSGNVENTGGQGGAGGCYWEEFIWFEPGDSFAISVGVGGIGGGAGSGAGTASGGGRGGTTTFTSVVGTRHCSVKSIGGAGGAGGVGVSYTNYTYNGADNSETIADVFMKQCSNIAHLKNVQGGGSRGQNTTGGSTFTSDAGSNGLMTGSTGGAAGSPTNSHNGADFAVCGGGGAGGLFAAGGVGGGATSGSGFTTSGSGGGGGGWSTAGSAGATGGSGGTGGAGGIRITFLGQDGTGNIT
jgi:hypothetical protein